MSSLHRRIAAVLVGAAVIGAPLTASAVATPASPYVVELACKKATIGGKPKCIAAGQFCAKRYEKDYNRYGYTCNNQDANGRWHLRAKK